MANPRAAPFPRRRPQQPRAQLEARDEVRMSALELAGHAERIDVVDLLLQHGARAPG
jgi:hypothetical protein